MTEEQLRHYLRGGLFKAKYNPDPTVVYDECHRFIGKEILVYPNVCIGPIVTGKYKGDFRFNTSAFEGWFPETDIEIISMINDGVEVDPLPIWIYKLLYTKQEQIEPNFGKGMGKLANELVIEREYSTESDEYVLGLSDPQATKIEKAKFDGSLPLKWETIYEQS